MIWDQWKNIHINKKVKHSQETIIYHGLANSLPMSMSNANQKYLISTMWIRMTLSKPHDAHNSHKQRLQISPTYTKSLLLQTQIHNSKVPIHPITLSYSKQTNFDPQSWVIFQPKNLPNYSSKKPTHVLLGVFSSPMWEESWAKAAKSFAIMPIYKILILFLDR